jgi:V/A-type H+-transporting ATPase subunit F
MKYFVVCDNADTHIGLRMAGIEGVKISQPREAEEAIREAMADKDIAVLLVTEKVADMVPELLADMRLNVTKPLTVVIPDRHGTTRPPDSITRYIREAIGVKL